MNSYTCKNQIPRTINTYGRRKRNLNDKEPQGDPLNIFTRVLGHHSPVLQGTPHGTLLEIGIMTVVLTLLIKDR